MKKTVMIRSITLTQMIQMKSVRGIQTSTGSGSDYSENPNINNQLDVLRRVRGQSRTGAISKAWKRRKRRSRSYAKNRTSYWNQWWYGVNETECCQLLLIVVDRKIGLSYALRNPSGASKEFIVLKEGTASHNDIMPEMFSVIMRVTNMEAERVCTLWNEDNPNQQ